ncbi:hypothetical protein ES703_79950 [subsurface metagenome]
MNRAFFKNIIGVEVNVTYQDGKKVSYVDGKVQSTTKEFVVIVNPDCAVCIRYDSLITCRTKNGEVKKE